MTGRVMLDVKQQCVRPKLLESGSALGSYNGSVLIEVYRKTFSEPTTERSEIFIPGIWTDTISLTEGYWQITGHEEVDPTAVDFPESFIGHGARTILFRKGEIKLPIDMTNEEYDQLRIRGAINASGFLGETCLYYLGRKDEINDPDLVDVELRSLQHSDLRFNEFRSEAYRRLCEDENQSYCEMALKHGHDIRRFYEIDKAKKKQLDSNLSPLNDDETVIACPYCLSIVGDKDVICNTCHEDMTRDAQFEMTSGDYRTRKRVSCRFCNKSMLELTVLCPHCLKWQDGRNSAA